MSPTDSGATRNGGTRSGPISRDDIEAKLVELKHELEERVEPAKSIVPALIVGVAVTAVVVAYWMGRRRGRKRNLVVELRRI